MKVGEDIKQESQQWVATCGHCQKTHSIWDIGGVRYKASGSFRALTRCPHCRKIRFNKYAKQS